MVPLQEDYTLVIEAQGDHLLVRARGVRTRATVIAMSKEILEAAVAHRLSHVLVDVRELKGQLGTLDSVAIVSEVFDKIRGKGLRKAAIVDVFSPGGSFLETVARNRGYNFRVFADQPEALAWLKL